MMSHSGWNDLSSSEKADDDVATMSANTFGIFTQNRIQVANDTIQHSLQNAIQSITRIANAVPFHFVFYAEC